MQAPNKVDVHSESFLNSLMRRQFRLSLFCAALFMAGLFGLPLANYYLPDLMATRVFGFTLSWLILGVGFFPAVWLIAWFFIKYSMALEESEVAAVQGVSGQSAANEAKPEALAPEGHPAVVGSSRGVA
jgi:uncharacterized membrane protein (DUF485 family)